MSITRLLAKLANALHRRRSHSPKSEDLVLGVPAERNSSNPFVVMPAALRAQHLGIVGLSGHGKTYFIEHMVRQDIKQKTGLALFDVHGDLADAVVAFLAERACVDRDVYRRTVILEPFDPQRSFGFNPLERNPNTSAFLQAQEFTAMLRQRWGEDLLSPRTEELLRNSLYTLAENNETLLRLPALLSDPKTRTTLVKKLEPGHVRNYWNARYDQLSPKMQTAYREPLLSRVSSFIADPQIRDIVGQRKSTFSFQEAMQKGLWVIINLSKGRLGENSKILGSMLFTKLELDIMALAQVPEENRKLFVVYADELRSLSGDTFARLIAEARKYRVSLVAGHQFWKQLDAPLREALLAVGSRAFFRLHFHDALELAGELAATERKRYIRLLTSLEPGEVIIRLGNKRAVLVSVPSHRAANPTVEDLQKLRETNAERYTVARSDIHEHFQPQEANTNKRGNQTFSNSETNTL
jgi:hypothetical protein